MIPPCLRSTQKRSQEKISTPDVLFTSSIMKKKSCLNSLIFLGLASLTVAICAIATRYPGLINLKVELGPGSGQVTIDGRPNNPPTLPPIE